MTRKIRLTVYTDMVSDYEMALLFSSSSSSLVVVVVLMRSMYPPRASTTRCRRSQAAEQVYFT